MSNKNGRFSHDSTGGVSAAVLEKAATTTNTDAITRSGIEPGKSKFSISPALVKGTRGPGDKTPDFDEESRRRVAAEKTFMAAIQKGMHSPEDVISGLSPMFGGPLGNLLQANPYHQLAQWAKTIDKGFSLSSPLGSGLLPYDLVAPTLLIYPVFSPLRNRFPRPQGQGKSHEAKVLTSILGSQAGMYGNKNQRISISELPSGGSLTSWPNQLPSMGSQNAADVNIPYKFFGLTEAVTWLAQFSGQGFDDIAALASLVLLQEVMLAEERSIIGATGTNLATPAVPSVTAGNGTNTGYVFVTAVNYYGETAPSTGVEVTTLGGSTAPIVHISPVKGALAYNVYVSATSSVSAAYLVATVGGSNYTLTITEAPTSGTTAPTADTGTGSSTDYEGLVSILSGWASDQSGPAVYPEGYGPGYYDGTVGDTLSVDVVANALREVYNGSSGSYFADPAELWCEASDLTNLSQSLADSDGDVNYTLFVQQDQVSNVIAGVAVSQFANPVTRSTVKLTVHPYFPQGTCAGLSYTLPQVQTNVSNVWENVMVQDYISINWPVIDITFRYSLFFYGTLFCPAPQYNFMLQGLQRTAPAASSGSAVYS